MIDLRPTAAATAAVVRGVRPDQLTHATPCPQYTVGDLLDHIAGLALAFTAAATKTALDGGDAPEGAIGDASRLVPDWQTVIPERLDALAAAWADPAAWTGTTAAGGVEMPGEIAGLVALDEVLVHGWDLAVATGQPYAAADGDVDACIATMAPQPGEERPAGDDVPFGAPVPVGADAPRLQRLVALLGRDPAWRAATGSG